MNKKGTNGVVAGSIWESRMKIDEFKGGIMVFKSEETLEDSNNPTDEETIITNYNGVCTSLNTTEKQFMNKRVNSKPKQTKPGLGGKRRTWNSDSIEGHQIQIARQISEMTKNVDEQCRKVSISADGTKKSPIYIMKARSEANEELSSPVESIGRTPFQRMKARSVSQTGLTESSNSIEKPRKIKSQTNKILNEAGNETNPETKILDHSSGRKFLNTLQMVRAKSASSNEFDEKRKTLNVSGGETEPSSAELRTKQLEKRDGIKRTEPDENFKYVGVCEEKLITSTSVNVGRGKSATKCKMIDDQEQSLTDDHDEFEDWDKVAKEEVEEIKGEIEKKKHHQSKQRRASISSVVVKKLSPAILRNVSVHPSPSNTKSIPTIEELRGVSRSHSKLESFVDLVMWRDVPKSAFILGVGTFVIVSSSYTQDLHISMLSVLSYIGLVYLAAIFLLRYFTDRRARDVYSTSQGHAIIGEEEAVWLIKLILPYVNEFLLKVRALFSGDPATTVKMAVLLFVLARFGSSITIWKMAKLGFFGVLVVPKVWCSYSSQTTAYGKFWIESFRDAW